MHATSKNAVLKIASLILVSYWLLGPVPLFGAHVYFTDAAAGDYRIAEIRGLEIVGVHYNAHFYYDTTYRGLAEDLFPPNPSNPRPIDSENALIRFGDNATAETALQAIVDAINATNIDASPPGISASGFLVPIEVVPIGAGEHLVRATRAFRSTASPLRYFDVNSADTALINVFENSGDSAWITFNYGTAIPEPGTAALLFAGFLSVVPWALFRRLKKSNGTRSGS